MMAYPILLKNLVNHLVAEMSTICGCEEIEPRPWHRWCESELLQPTSRCSLLPARCIGCYKRGEMVP